VRHALERLILLAENGWEKELRRELSDLLPEAKLNMLRRDPRPAPAESPACLAVNEA
jgi:hypothetical protein